MFKKVLIANRGEIAVRVIRACKELGIKSVAIYSSADKKAVHRVYADEAYYIGKSDPRDSYLNIDKIINLAKRIDVDAIHPGYGFLAENAEFAKRCNEEGIIFIGPKPKAIKIAGSKVHSRKEMQDAGVPTIPGSPKLEDVDDAIKWAEKVGYPVAIKASGGGGGIGISVAYTESELEDAFKRSKKLGENYFRDPTIYLEKYLERPRHIEVQILADEHGNVIHLGERECSIQRRHQKLIEEAPSPIVTEDVREELGKMAVKGAKKIGYTNAGTFEFLYEKGNFYFLEINARLQVEHTITEIVTGIDIVKYQILLAAGEELRHNQEDITFRGHAIECRINAEDPINFYPRSGKIVYYRSPGGIGVRVDSGVHMGYTIPPEYDSMISKLITYGETREEAIARMRRALYEYVIDGIETNIPFHLAVLHDEEFIKGNTHTKFVTERNISSKVRKYIEVYEALKRRMTVMFQEEEFSTAEISAILAAIEKLESESEETSIESRIWRAVFNLGA